MNALGRHLLIELDQCDESLLDDLQFIEETMVVAAEKAGATIVGKSFHKFEPSGVTGVVTIAESHICIHTWPEHAYASMDIFTCGITFNPNQAAQFIIQSLGCSQPSITEISRGPVTS